MTDASGESEVVKRALARALSLDQQNRMRHFFHRRVLPDPPGSRVLFLAPHPDDIVIGCGGTVVQYTENSTPLHFLYFTDGRASATQSKDEEAMARTRAEEARAVARALGRPDPELWECNEHEFTSEGNRANLTDRLGQTLDRFDPDTVYVPYLFDQHRDHRYANVLLADVLRERPRERTILGYEVWSFVPPGVVIDISAQLERKKELIRLYASQMKLLDYMEFAEAVGRGHASLAGDGALAAEVFCPFRRDTYLEAVDAVDLASEEGLSTSVLLTAPCGPEL